MLPVRGGRLLGMDFSLVVVFVARPLARVRRRLQRLERQRAELGEGPPWRTRASVSRLWAREQGCLREGSCKGRWEAPCLSWGLATTVGPLGCSAWPAGPCVDVILRNTF